MLRRSVRWQEHDINVGIVSDSRQPARIYGTYGYLVNEVAKVAPFEVGACPRTRQNPSDCL